MAKPTPPSAKRYLTPFETPFQKVQEGLFPNSVLVATGALLISFAPILVRFANIGPTVAGFYRTLFGALFLILVTLIANKRLVWHRGQISAALSAALCFAVGLTFWHRSIHIIGPGLSTILANFQVFFLALIGVLVLKEKIGFRLIAAMVLAVAGLYFLVGIDAHQMSAIYRYGCIFGLIAAIAYALYVLSLRKLQTRVNMGGAIANFAAVSLLCALIMGIEGWLQGESFVIRDLETWAAMLALGLFCQAIGWVLISKGLPAINASHAGLLLLLQPTGAFIWDIVLFKRTTTGLEYLGAAMALSAIYFGSKHQ